MTAGVTSPYQNHHNSTKAVHGIGIIMDDDDGRTRNAKAQRRHREKRKAHLKTLEDSVNLLTGQLEDARRQLSTAAYNSRLGVSGGPLSPGSKDFMALQQENTYLREENAELRRQLYNYQVGSSRYGHSGENDVKTDPGFGYGQGGLTSPREPSNSHGRDHLPPPPESSSGPSSATSYHHPNNASDHFTPLSRGSRSRVMSSSSAPNASPYLPTSSSFPTDPRAHALSQPAPPPQSLDRYPPIRYDSQVYSSPANHSPTGPGPAQPPPHNLPRSGLSYEHVDMYGDREQGGSSWGPEAGPPPFQGSVYPVTYSDGPPQEEWRSAQDHSH